MDFCLDEILGKRYNKTVYRYKSAYSSHILLFASLLKLSRKEFLKQQGFLIDREKTAYGVSYRVILPDSIYTYCPSDMMWKFSLNDNSRLSTIVSDSELLDMLRQVVSRKYYLQSLFKNIC